MKKNLLLFVSALFMVLSASANNDWLTEPVKLQVPELKLELGTTTEASAFETVKFPEAQPKMDLDFFKSKTNPGTKPYKFMDDMTFVGVPLFVAGMIIKGDKAMFRVNNKEGKENTQLLTNFKTGIDDYSQYFGPAVTVGLKLAGYEGRSDWPRLLASAGMSYGLMAILVNGIKYTAKEMRPDGSQANSWPSGHTATSFVGATLLHKEYGLTRSPWFSVAGYGVATATGVMRVLNNRHWISDVLSGAGIGILSTELGYAFCDLLFKGKGLLRNDLLIDSENPSFFGISMGFGLGSKSIGFGLQDVVGVERFTPEELGYEEGVEYDDEEGPNIQFRAASVVDAEGAYFFNKYIGIGGRFRVRAMSAKSFGQYSELAAEDQVRAWEEAIGGIYGINQSDDAAIDFYKSIMEGGSPVDDLGGKVESDHMTEFSASLGLYLNIPLDHHWSLGAKALIGRSFTQELDIDGYAKGHVKDMNYSILLNNGVIDPDQSSITYPFDTGQTYDVTWNYLTLGAKNSTTWGTGISVTYRYKSNFAWRLYADYDSTEKEFTMTYDPYNYLKAGLGTNGYTMVSILSPKANLLDPIEFRKKKIMNYFTIGLSFMVNL